MVLYGLASLHFVSTQMSGHAGSISDQRRETLNLGLRGKPWWLLWSPSPPVTKANKRMFVAVLSKFLYPWVWHKPLIDEDKTNTYTNPCSAAVRSAQPTPMKPLNASIPTIGPIMRERNTCRSHQSSLRSRVYLSNTCGSRASRT